MKKAGKTPKGGAGKQKKHRVSNLILVLILLVGVVIAGYPAFSDYWNSMHQSRAIQGYAERVAELTNDEYITVWEKAMDYNRRLACNPNPWAMTEEDFDDYEQQLNVDGTGNMGFISIPKINVNLPIYHGTSDRVLQTSIGHIAGTSLPTGSVHPDEDDYEKVKYASHSVLSGHRGLPSAKLFSELDAMEIGDVFYLTILDQTLTYQVDKITVILPEDSSELTLFPGKDYCTLMTCTPYGINTHRILVRGTRIETEEEESAVIIIPEAIRIPNYIAIPAVAVPILFLLLLFSLFVMPRKKNNMTDEEILESIKRDNTDNTDTDNTDNTE